MKTIFLTSLLILAISCKKQIAPGQATTSHSHFTSVRDYNNPLILQKKFRYYKDLNTIFITSAKLNGKPC